MNLANVTLAAKKVNQTSQSNDTNKISDPAPKTTAKVDQKPKEQPKQNLINSTAASTNVTSAPIIAQTNTGNSSVSTQ